MRESVLLLGLIGCAPAYHPGAVHAPVFDGPQQISVLALYAESGGHLAAAYAPVDHFAVRLKAQNRFLPTNETYWLVGGGVEGFSALSETMRFSVAAELGYGRVDAFDSIVILGSTTNYQSNGALLQVAVPITAAWDLGVIETGMVARVVSHTIFNDLQWAGSTQGTLGIMEVHGFFRVGKTVAFETQGGFSAPLFRDGDVGRGYFPIHLGIGAVLDLDLKPSP